MYDVDCKSVFRNARMGRYSWWSSRSGRKQGSSPFSKSITCDLFFLLSSSGSWSTNVTRTFSLQGHDNNSSNSPGTTLIYTLSETAISIFNTYLQPQLSKQNGSLTNLCIPTENVNLKKRLLKLGVSHSNGVGKIWLIVPCRPLCGGRSGTVDINLSICCDWSRTVDISLSICCDWSLTTVTSSWTWCWVASRQRRANFKWLSIWVCEWDVASDLGNCKQRIKQVYSKYQRRLI